MARLATGFLIALFLMVSGAWARPTTPDQAKQVVDNWLSLDRRPLGAFAVTPVRVKEAQTFADAAGNPLYYVVYLNPAGFVIVPGEDLVEPIIGFLPEGIYDPSPANPLGALVSRDVPGRVVMAREAEVRARDQGLQLLGADSLATAQRKWAWLQNPRSLEGAEFGLPNISDVRVAPLLATVWSQTTDSNYGGGNPCYNYYTPNNWPCGCVATAMAQIMRFHQRPSAGVGTGSFTIKINGFQTTDTLLGGNEAGGPYDWGNMVGNPALGATLTQRKAIGVLTHDAGLSVNTDYGSMESGGNDLKIASALKTVFKYSNAHIAFNSNKNIPSANLNNMLNPNLDAQFPVALGINSASGGHDIVADGYGYNSSTLYHHLNLGWADRDGSNAWYNLPNINSSPHSYDLVDVVNYNIFITGTGEIISGRVTDTSGNPLGGAKVSATGGYSTTTNSNGIYALAKIPSGTTFTVSVSKSGYAFTSQSVATGTSTDYAITTGNRWGIDFVGTGGRAKKVITQIYELLLLQ